MYSIELLKGKLPDNLIIRNLRVFRKIDNSDDFELEAGHYLKDWSAGTDLHLTGEIEIDSTSGFRLTDSHSCLVTWYCPVTHIRLFLSTDNINNDGPIFEGSIKGSDVRGRIELIPHLINSAGDILLTGEKYVLHLEGDSGFFPMSAMNFSGHDKDAFLRIEIPHDATPDYLVSPETCKMIFNRMSGFTDEEGIPSGNTIEYFALYEVRRQFIETALNNETFTEYSNINDDELTLGAAWTKAILFVFHPMTLGEVRNYRKNNYPEFCSRIQSYCFASYNMNYSISL